MGGSVRSTPIAVKQSAPKSKPMTFNQVFALMLAGGLTGVVITFAIRLAVTAAPIEVEAPRSSIDPLAHVAMKSLYVATDDWNRVAILFYKDLITEVIAVKDPYFIKDFEVHEKFDGVEGGDDNSCVLSDEDALIRIGGAAMLRGETVMLIPANLAIRYKGKFKPLK